MSHIVKPQVARLYKAIYSYQVFFRLLFTVSSYAPDCEPLSYIDYNCINMTFSHLLIDLLISYTISHS